MNRAARGWIFLAILSAALSVYLLGNNSVQLWDRDEPRYAQTSRQMLESGDWVVPRFLDTVRTAKPVLIYWCQAASMSVLGDNAFAARLPSALAMVLTLALLAIAIGREAGSNRALWTIFIFGTCALAIGAAKMCLTDSVLLLWITIGQLCIYRLWRYGFCPWTAIVLGLSIGLAGLTKGPVALGVNLTTILALAIFGKTTTGEKSRLETEHFPVLAGVVLAMIFVVVFPWLYLIQSRAPEFLATSIGHDVIARAQRGQEGHSFPPGFYLLAVWGTYFPWSLLIPAALVGAWKHRHLPTTRFALAALVGPWVMFELVAGKLPHYVLPTYPALAYLTADLILRASRGGAGELRDWGFKLLAYGGALIVVIVGFAPWAGVIIAKQYDLWLMVAASAFAITAMLVGPVAAWEFHRHRPLAAGRTLGMGMLLMVAIAYSQFIPRFGPLQMSRQIADIFVANGAQGAHGFMIDYKEPSLAFHQGGGLREQRDDDYLNTTPSANWPDWIVITSRVWDSARPEVHARLEVIGRVHGLAYNEGGRDEVLVLRKVNLGKP